MNTDLIKTMIGKEASAIIRSNDNEHLIFRFNDGSVYWFYHEQDCSESVSIEDIAGDLDDLLWAPLVVAEERINSQESVDFESHTWTFYEFATRKGSVTVRWHGESNGYYSESVDLKVYQYMPQEGDKK